MVYSTFTGLLKTSDSIHTGNPEKKICFHRHSSSQVKRLVVTFKSSKLFYEHTVTTFNVPGEVQSNEITER